MLNYRLREVNVNRRVSVNTGLLLRITVLIEIFERFSILILNEFLFLILLKL